MQRSLSFKNFYIQEAYAQRELEGKIKMLVYGQSFILFFNFEGDVYGGSEDARLTYATMKSEENDGVEEMVFGARNLSDEINGKASERFFTIEDIDHIEVITNREAEELLHKNGKQI